jgi:hypothetical protein
VLDDCFMCNIIVNMNITGCPLPKFTSTTILMREIFKNLFPCSVKVFLHHDVGYPQLIYTQLTAHRLNSRKNYLETESKAKHENLA